MSLKAFHIFFVFASIVMAFGFAVWCLLVFKRSGGNGYLAGGVGAIVAGVALIYYARYVLRKLKDVSYL